MRERRRESNGEKMKTAGAFANSAEVNLVRLCWNNTTLCTFVPMPPGLSTRNLGTLALPGYYNKYLLYLGKYVPT